VCSLSASVRLLAELGHSPYATQGKLSDGEWAPRDAPENEWYRGSGSAAGVKPPSPTRLAPPAPPRAREAARCCICGTGLGRRQ
jgi:hypothetical protein